MGARFEALDEGVLAAASKSTGYFFAISISQKVRCDRPDDGINKYSYLHCIRPRMPKTLLLLIHRTLWEIEMAKKYPVDFEAVARTPSSRASKRAPT